MSKLNSRKKDERKRGEEEEINSSIKTDNISEQIDHALDKSFLLMVTCYFALNLPILRSLAHISSHFHKEKC